MKTIFKFLFVLFVVIGTTAFSCKKKEDLIIDPAKAILGKWEIIKQGNWPNMEPYKSTGYVEYLPDSIIGTYNYATKEYKYSNEKYWIDTLLHKNIYREDGFILTFEYYYKFSQEELQLDVKNWLMIYNTSIYKRIN